MRSTTAERAPLWWLLIKDILVAITLGIGLCAAYRALDVLAAAFQHWQGY